MKSVRWFLPNILKPLHFARSILIDLVSVNKYLLPLTHKKPALPCCQTKKIAKLSPYNKIADMIFFRCPSFRSPAEIHFFRVRNRKKTKKLKKPQIRFSFSCRSDPITPSSIRSMNKNRSACFSKNISIDIGKILKNNYLLIAYLLSLPRLKLHSWAYFLESQ